MNKKGNVKRRKQKFILALFIYLIAVLVVTTKIHADELLEDINDLIAFISKENNAVIGIYYSKDQFQPIIKKAATRHKLDPHLIEAIIKVESDFNPNAVSHKGAQGLMQLMPETAKEIGVTRPYDPYQNIMGGSQYYRLMFDRFGNHKKALYAYNCGPECVENNRIPGESKKYALSVIRVYKNLKRKEKEK